MACSHLLWISWVGWDFVGSLFHEMVHSHLIFHIMYMDSETIILNSLLRPLSGCPAQFARIYVLGFQY